MGAGSYALAAATPAAGQAALQALVFTPAAHQVPPGSAVSTDFAVTATNDGAATASGTASVVATAVDDPPVLGGFATLQPVADDASLQPLATVTLSDPDLDASETVTITVQDAAGAATDADGTLSGTGLTRVGAGSYALAAAIPAVEQAALQALVFTPAAHQVPPGSAVTTDFAVTATNDGAATASGTASVVATAALDPPVLGGTVPNQPAIFGVPLNPFTMVTIADPDAGTMETAAIILLSSTGSPTDANGTLTGAGLTKNGVGSYSLAPASTAAEQAALEALSFTPTPNQAPAGSIVATQFLLSISDGSLATSSNGASIVAGNSNPVTVTGVSVNPANSILGSGASAVFTLQMSAPVSVTGAPTLA